MPFILSLAESLLGWGKIALAWLAKLPWYVLALGVCVVALVWQHSAEVRKDARIASLSATLDQVKVAQAQAQIAAQAAHDAQEAAYRAKAQEADNAYQTQLVDARNAAARYIADHRVDGVRADGSSSGGATVASASRDGAGLPAPVPTSAVVVSGDDVQRCTDAVTYGLKARDWAMGLGN